MAHVNEHDLMIRFYLAETSVQQALLDDYQHLSCKIRKELTFLHFLEDNFEQKVILEKIYSGVRVQTFPQISV